MTLLALVARALEAHGVAHAVIGATALAVHGVSRSTADIDLLVTDPRCFDAAVWGPLEAAGATVDMRRGDADDPLAGVIRISREEEPPVDVIAGRSTWQAAIIARAVRADVAGATVPIAAPADVVLLKLYAGGPQDAWDIAQLLDAAPAIEPLVDAAISALPAECAVLWRRIRDRRA
jgi:hypothetical protein